MDKKIKRILTSKYWKVEDISNEILKTLTYLINEIDTNKIKEFYV